jgi:hypothetical protein
MSHQLINLRNSYKFPEYIDTKKVPSRSELEIGIRSVMLEEFSLIGEIGSIDKASNSQVSSNGQFTSVICLETGDLHFFAIDVETKEHGFILISKEMYFSNAFVYRWKNIEEVDDVKFEFN